jgi:hypothetical protein
MTNGFSSIPGVANGVVGPKIRLKKSGRRRGALTWFVPGPPGGGAVGWAGTGAAVMAMSNRRIHPGARIFIFQKKATD